MAVNPSSILSRASSVDIAKEPFPHLILADVIEPTRYEGLAAAFPGLDVVSGGDEIKNNSAYLMHHNEVRQDETIDPTWKEFFEYHTSPDFFHDFLQLFGSDMRRLYPDLEAFFGSRLESLHVTNRSHTWDTGQPSVRVELDCQFGINSPVTAPTTVRGPHVDSRYKFFNALCYFRDQDDTSTGGDLQLYRFRGGKPVFDGKQPDAADLEPLALVPYCPNTLIMWVNNPHAVHGVTVRQPTSFTRRYVNFSAECYKLPSDQLFARPQKTASRIRRAARMVAQGDFGGLAGAMKQRVLGNH